MALPSATLQAARNEFESFQIVVQPGATPATITDATLAGLTGPGNAIAGSNITIYKAGEYTVNIASDLEGATGRWFDALIPTVDPIYREARNAFPHVVQANENANIWVDILVPTDQVTDPSQPRQMCLAELQEANDKDDECALYDVEGSVPR